MNDQWTMDSERIKDSIPSGNDAIDNSDERVCPPSKNARDTMEESSDRDSMMPAKKEEGDSIIMSSSPTWYSSTPLEVSKLSSTAANKKSAPRKKRMAKPTTGGSLYREIRELKPTPYFYYIDHSRDVDEDPLAPLSPALTIPTFIIKLHAILIRDSLRGVIGWMHHGRSWKILNQVNMNILLLLLLLTRA